MSKKLYSFIWKINSETQHVLAVQSKISEQMFLVGYRKDKSYNYLFQLMARILKVQDFKAIQNVRNHMKEVGLHSASTYQDEPNYQQSSIDELHAFLLKNSRIKDISILSYEIINKSTITKDEYTIYEIQISTSDFFYKIGRRYKEFYDFYKSIKKYLHVKTDFPKKIYNPFVSSTSQSISRQRIVKLNLFLRECFELIQNNCSSQLLYAFYNFFQIKENFERNSMKNSFYKSNSQKIALQNYPLTKTFKSFNNSTISMPNENNIQMKIIFLNKNKNAKKCIADIQQYLKEKKGKISNEEIKIMILGFDDYKGLLRFGINNAHQINRIAALQLLVNLFSAEKNMYYEKYLKMIDKIPSIQFTVYDISNFENAEFKLNYFKILKIYCEIVQKQSNKLQKYIIKDLFLFHQELFNDYLNYKKISSVNFTTEYTKMSNMNVQHENDYYQRIEIVDFQQQGEENMIYKEENQIGLYIFDKMKTIVFMLQTDKGIEELKTLMLKWNRYTTCLTLDQYSDKIRAIMNISHQKFHLKINTYLKHHVTEQPFYPIREAIKQIKQTKKHSIDDQPDYSIVKSYQQVQFQTDYRQQIELRQFQGKVKILIAINYPGVKHATDKGIDDFASSLIEDLSNLSF